MDPIQKWHITLTAVTVAASIGCIGSVAVSSVGRNPGAATKILVQSILAIAFCEALVFYVIFLVK
jgi:F-type H+-transporting ATPase subunit c